MTGPAIKTKVVAASLAIMLATTMGMKSAAADTIDPDPSDPGTLESVPSLPQLSEEDYDLLRSEMVEALRHQPMALGPGLRNIRFSEALLDAFEAVPRHAFVPEDIRIYSYLDTPLPVSEGATVSQPFITAYMLHLLDVDTDDDVLQAAIGGGYETAILRELGRSVSGMEFHAPVAETAIETLAELGYTDVDIREGDIYYGWPENRRFDAILVRMAMPYVPDPLVNQLRPGGRLVAPIGPDEGPQELMLITKDEDGSISRERGISVRFQPLPGGMRL